MAAVTADGVPAMASAPVGQLLRQKKKKKNVVPWLERLFQDNASWNLKNFF